MFVRPTLTWPDSKNAAASLPTSAVDVETIDNVVRIRVATLAALSLDIYSLISRNRWTTDWNGAGQSELEDVPASPRLHLQSCLMQVDEIKKKKKKKWLSSKIKSNKNKQERNHWLIHDVFFLIGSAGACLFLLIYCLVWWLIASIKLLVVCYLPASATSHLLPHTLRSLPLIVKTKKKP